MSYLMVGGIKTSVAVATRDAGYDEGYAAGLAEGAGTDTLYDFYAKWFDVEIGEITIGANNVTNALELSQFLQEAIGGDAAQITLLDDATQRDQYVGSFSITTSTYILHERYRDGILNKFTAASSGYSVNVVEGTRYKYIKVMER